MAETYHYAGYSIATRDEALFCLFNNESSDARRYFTITGFDIRPASPTSATPGRTFLSRISALSGGTDIPLVKMDTASTSLPSQVKLRWFPQSVTTTGTMFSRLQMPHSIAGLTLPATGQRLPTARVSNFSNQASAQALVLREGEGIALIAGASDHLPMNACWLAAITVRSGSETHTAMFSYSPVNLSEASFALINESGSGVVLELLEFTATYIGQPTITTNIIDAPLVRFCRVVGHDGGESQTPLPRDTSSSLPGAAIFKRNQAWAPLTVQLDANKTGLGPGDLLYPESNQALVRRIGLFRQALTHMRSIKVPGGTTPGIASEFEVQKPRHGIDFRGSVAPTGIVLNPQEGFAAIVNNATPYCGYWVDLEFTHTAPPPGGGGGETVAYTFCS